MLGQVSCPRTARWVEGTAGETCRPGDHRPQCVRGLRRAGVRGHLVAGVAHRPARPRAAGAVLALVLWPTWTPSRALGFDRADAIGDPDVRTKKSLDRPAHGHGPVRRPARAARAAAHGLLHQLQLMVCSALAARCKRPPQTPERGRQARRPTLRGEVHPALGRERPRRPPLLTVPRGTGASRSRVAVAGRLVLFREPRDCSPKFAASGCGPA